MISIEKARKLIGDKNLTDEEIKKIQDDLGVLAEIILDRYIAEKKAKKIQNIK